MSARRRLKEQIDSGSEAADPLGLAAAAAGLGVWDWDLVAGTITYSARAKAILGWEPDQPVSLDLVRAAVHPEDLPVTWPMAERALDPAQRESLPYEYRIVRPDGEVRWVLAHGLAMFAKHDGVERAVRYVGAIQDITERKRIEEALRDSEEQLRALADNLPGGMIYQVETDEAGAPRFTYVSSSCERINGVSVAAALADAQALYGLIHPQDATRLAEAERQGDRLGRGVDMEVRGRRADGAWRWSRIASSPRRAASGRLVWDGIQIDVDARHRAETELIERTRALEALNRSGAQLAAERDRERLVLLVVEAGVEALGAAIGAFFYPAEADGQTMLLHAVAGAGSDAFAGFPAPRETAVFGPTLRGEALWRSDDITADPRFGLSPPHCGLPPGHPPVRSYLAAPVRSRGGEVLGGLFFGHPEPARFGPASEALITSLAGQAAVAIDNARLFADLQALNATLEERVTTEVARRLQAEEALRQAQKMEAVGQLTGGVAHDFNNLLTLIIGGLEMIGRAPAAEEARIRRAAAIALEGAERAAALTGRLLSFSRRQPLAPRVLDLDRLIAGMDPLLRRAVGEQITLVNAPGADLPAIEVDPNQLESAILNLAINARDAMPGGGRLSLSTSLVEDFSAGSEPASRRWVRLEVADTGPGMDRQTMERAFEPFFTTKPVDKGAGLGLSMVYGFVTQSLGRVELISEPGSGLTVRLEFPATDQPCAPIQPARSAEPIADAVHGERVLVVEDNPQLRAFVVSALRDLGYQVAEAADGECALALLETTAVSLLFTDVVLPGISGRVLADRAKCLRPQIEVLFTTGYARDAIVHDGRLDPDVKLLAKPFTVDQLAARVRAVLDGSGDGAQIAQPAAGRA